MAWLRSRRERRALDAAWNELADRLLSGEDPDRPGYGISQPAARAGVRGVGGRIEPPRIAVSIPVGVAVPVDVPAEFKGFPVVIERFAEDSYETLHEEPVPSL